MRYAPNVTCTIEVTDTFLERAKRHWKRKYLAAKAQGLSFDEAIELFVIQRGYYPPIDIPLMPKNEMDFFREVAEVSQNRLCT